MKVGELCAGYGGISMGLALAGEDVDLRWLAEFDRALDPLHPPGVPNLGDLTLIDWSTGEPVDLLTAGFPCQPVSAAGAQLAEADPRWLWPEVHRAIATLRPPRVLLENVRNLVSMRKGEIWAYILTDLTTLGYDVRWLTLGACAVGAAHHRHRVFALASLAYPVRGTGQVQRLDVQECGARRGPNGGAVAVPTPTATDSRDSRNLTAGRSPDARPSSTGTTLGDLAVIVGALLPSPQSRDGQGRGTPSVDTAEARFASGRRNLDDGLALLPSPAARDGSTRGEGDARFWAERLETRGPKGRPLGAELGLLEPEHWGRFAAAVARHAAIFGSPPAPTEPNRNGAPRLAPAFAEWLMVIPPGHVTARLPRSAALKAIGNGVCPPQLARAWRYLTGVDRPSDTSLGSHLVTTVTEVQQHNAQSRERVIAKGHGGLEGDTELVANAVQAAMMELAAIWREEAAAFVEAKRRGWKSTADGRTQAAALLAGFAVGLTTVRTGTLTITPGEIAAARNQGTYDITGVTGTVAEEAGSLTVSEADEAAAQAEAETAAAFDAMREACSHPDSARSTLKSGVIMCTLCNQAVGQVEHLPALVPGSRPGPVITGDPTMDYLTGAVDRYEPFGYVPHRLEVPAEMIPAETPPGALAFPGQPGYREAEHGRPQAPCFECVSIDEDPAPWCDCTPQDGQPCKGPCRLLAHAYTFHPQGCAHFTKHNSLPVVCMYCGADVTEVFHPTGGWTAGPTDEERQNSMVETVIYDPTMGAALMPDNPFTSPAAPTRNRPAVARLTYADLGPLTAATYPYPRAHLSHSYVESLSKCGLSALLSDASRAGHIAPRRPSWSLIGGNAFHVAVEGIERASIAIGGAAPTAELGDWELYWNTALNSQIDEVRESLAGSPYADPATWHIANKGLEGYDWWRVQGLDMVQRYLAHHDTAWRSTHTLLQVPSDPASTPEHASRVPVLELPFTVSAGSTSITMEGHIDAAWLATGPEYATATLEVVDHKAGKSLPVDHFQLVEYADVLRKHLPPNFALSVVGRYWRARLGTYTPPVPLPAAPGQAEIDYRYSAAERAMKHAVFAPHVDNMCSSCGAVDLCPAQSMRDGASA